MKQIGTVTMLLLWSATICFGQFTVRLNNKDANMPIYLWTSDTLAPASEVSVDVLVGYPGKGTTPVPMVGTATTAFSLNEPGFFDAGIGYVGGITSGADIQFQVRAWVVTARHELVYDAADVRGMSATWIQKAGDPILHIPGPIILKYDNPPIPEPSTVTLGVVGAAAMLTNRVVKGLKSKATATTNATPKATTTSTSAKVPAGTNAVALPK